MNITRLYSGDDGQSHLEHMEVPMTMFHDIEGAYGWASSSTECSRVQWRRSPAGYALDWHTAPRKQYIIQLQGQVAITVGNGDGTTTAILGPGDVLLAEDLTGQGHCTAVVGDEPRVYGVLVVEKEEAAT